MELIEFFIGVLPFALVSAFPQFASFSSYNVVCWLILSVLALITLEQSPVHCEQDCSLLNVDEKPSDCDDEFFEMGSQESCSAAKFSYLSFKGEVIDWSKNIDILPEEENIQSREILWIDSSWMCLLLQNDFAEDERMQILNNVVLREDGGAADRISVVVVLIHIVKDNFWDLASIDFIKYKML